MNGISNRLHRGMPGRVRALALGVAASLLAMGATAAQAETYSFSRIFTLGDSLTDGGTYSNAIKAGNPAAPNILYRWLGNASDGSSRTYAEVLAARLGLTLTPDSINPVSNGGNNYAEGGSRVSKQPGNGNSPAQLITTIPVSTQVDRLLADQPKLNSRDLIVLWAGANDVLIQTNLVSAGAATTTQAGTAVATEAVILGAQVDRLKAAGASNIVVMLLPDIGAGTPLGQLLKNAGTGGNVLLSSLVSAFNTTAKSQLAPKGVFLIDTGKILSDITIDPARYGFNANTLGATACGVNPAPTGVADFYNSSLTCVTTNPNNFLFADSVHPSARTHQIFGAVLMASLRAIPQVASLATLPLATGRLDANEIDHRVHLNAMQTADGKARKVGSSQVFGGADVGNIKTDSNQLGGGFDGRQQRYTIGVDKQMSEGTMVGGMLSMHESRTDFGASSGRVKTTQVRATAYGSMAISERNYIMGSVSMGTVEHSDFRRDIALLSNTLTTRAKPDGRYTGIRIGVGSTYQIGSWRGGPLASFARETIKINGFDESGSPAAMSFGDMTHTSERASIGFSAMQQAPAGAWRAFLRISADRELRNDAVMVSAGPDQLSRAGIAVPRGDRNSMSSTIGMSRPAADGTAWVVSAGFAEFNGVESRSIGVSYRASF